MICMTQNMSITSETVKPYINFIVNKLECNLHVGKRMFRHLTEAKKCLTAVKKMQNKEKKESKEKAYDECLEKSVEEPVKKRGRRRKNSEPFPLVVKIQDLTHKIIKKMSLFYSIAIQQHPDNIDDMISHIAFRQYGQFTITVFQLMLILATNTAMLNGVNF